MGLDVSDGQSWFVLGNAYLAVFFGKLHDATALTHALKAYTRADKDPVQTANNPDLHYNKATVRSHRNLLRLTPAVSVSSSYHAELC